MRLLALLVLFIVPAIAAPQALNFPADWKLSDGAGEVKSAGGKSHVTVRGGGDDANYWRSPTLNFAPGELYQVKFRARGIKASGGTPTSGPVFANRDLGALGGEWHGFSTCFTTPTNLTTDISWLRLGQWHTKGEVAFDGVELRPAQAVHARNGDLVMGEGEAVSGNEYSMRAPLGGNFNNTSRALHSHNCNFNTDRWVFGAGSEVIYKHVIAGRRQTAAQIEIGVTWHAGGQLAVDVSRDGQTWKPLGTQDQLGVLTAKIPNDLLPADAIFIRLRAETKTKVGANSDPGSFQVGSYQFHSKVDGAALSLGGATRFFAIEKESPELKVRILEAGDGVPGGRNVVVVEVASGVTGVGWVRAGFNEHSVTQKGRGVFNLINEPLPMQVSYDLERVGEQTRHLYIGNDNGIWFQASTTWHVPDLYATNFGEKLPASNSKAALWWCSSGWKISRTRPAPSKTGTTLKISAARNESEAAQFVLRPQAELKNFTVSAAKLIGANGSTIDAANVEVLRVGYVNITQPTDPTGTAAPWPDPLPPLTRPLTLEPNKNQPFWVRVRVPKNAKPGVYKGEILLKADGYAATVPLQITVWNFTLPDRMTCETAFGFSPDNVFRYHNLKTEADKRRVLDLYFQSFAAHHISPYNPAPLDPFTVTWSGGSAWQGGTRSADKPHGGAQSLLVADDSKTQQFSAGFDKTFPIPAKGLRLSFWQRTREAGAGSIVTLNHRDAADQWMPGRNNDISFTGDGTWQKFERTITQFPDGAKGVRLSLWAAPWQDDGSPTGAVFYDDVSLTDLDSGKELLTGGDFENARDAPHPVFDWTRWDAAVEKALRTHHFNTFQMPIQGLGGGTFESRSDSQLLGYAENTPEYQAALREYLQGIESHLKAKGWLDKAFVYWFDEPDPKDYGFVMNGFDKLKKFAPGLRRMLTEQPEKELFGGPNLWCPVSSDFNSAAADERRKIGDKFWWYVCTGPKAPYATEFIDHSGTELRVWLWQTWQRGIGGVLIWDTNYWTSRTAYPDALQNPYRDPMSWVSGYSTKTGTKQPWGNGDGRFIYPPEDYDKTSAPILTGPVDSMRWELLRDGIEDYEYLAMLRRALKAKSFPAARRTQFEKLLTVPVEITKDATTFTRDLTPIEERRKEIALALEELPR